jgi:hypothetical protein
LKRLLVDMNGRLRFFRSNPGYSIRALVRGLTRADERFLSTVTDSSTRKFSRFMEEPIEDADFAEHIGQTRMILGRAAISTADLYAKKVLIQNAIVRALKPELSFVQLSVVGNPEEPQGTSAFRRNGQVECAVGRA